MLFDMRIYTCRYGTLQKQLALYREHGYEAQCRHLGKPVFFSVTETGPQNIYVHIWAYRDAADRMERRAAMEADPDWIRFKTLSAEAGNLIQQENRLMNATDFFSPAGAAETLNRFA